MLQQRLNTGLSETSKYKSVSKNIQHTVRHIVMCKPESVQSEFTAGNVECEIKSSYQII